MVCLSWKKSSLRVCIDLTAVNRCSHALLYVRTLTLPYPSLQHVIQSTSQSVSCLGQSTGCAHHMTHVHGREPPVASGL